MFIECRVLDWVLIYYFFELFMYLLILCKYFVGRSFLSELEIKNYKYYEINCLCKNYSGLILNYVIN